MLFAAVFLVLRSSFASSIDVLFLNYDLGDANAFKPIAEQLEKNNISYRIIAIGKAQEVFKNNDHLIPLPETSDNQAFINSRNQVLPKKELHELTAKVTPKIIISGMSSAALAEIMNFYNASVYKIAFYDNFDPLTSGNYTQAFFNNLNAVNVFFITANKIKESFSDKAKQYSAEVVTVGNPALDNWIQIYNKTKPNDIRTKLGIPENQKLVVFAGDTTDSYQQYFRIFAEAMAKLSDITAVVTYHPKMDGAFEQEVVNSLDAKNIRIIKPSEFSSIELSTLSNVFLVHKSSMGGQSLVVGKYVIFVAPSDYDNLFVKNGLAQLASDETSLTEKIQQGFQSTEVPSLSDYGVPKHPDQIILKQIQTHLQSSN